MHVDQGHVQHRHDEFQIVVRQITTAYDKFYILISLCNVGAIDSLYNFVAYK
jgi:hypothetical protein